MDVLGWGKRGDWWREVFIGEPLKPVSRGSEFGGTLESETGDTGEAGVGDDFDSFVEKFWDNSCYRF